MFDWGKFRNFALVKPKDVHQPLGWQALLTACEVLRTLSLENGRATPNPNPLTFLFEPSISSTFPVKGQGSRKSKKSPYARVLGDGGHQISEERRVKNTIRRMAIANGGNSNR